MQGILSYNALDDNFKVNYSELANKIYKLLPIFEGKNKNTNERISQDIAIKNFRKNLNVLCLEIKGFLSKIEITSNLLEVQMILEGLKVEVDLNHDILKDAIMHSLNLLKEIE